MALRLRASRLLTGVLLLVVLLSLLPPRLAAQEEIPLIDAPVVDVLPSVVPLPTEPAAVVPAPEVPTDPGLIAIPTGVAPEDAAAAPALSTETAIEVVPVPPVEPPITPGEPATGVPTGGEVSQGEPTARSKAVAPTLVPKPRSGTAVAGEARTGPTRTFTPSADARVERHRPTSKLGGSTSLRTAERVRSGSQVYLRFDVAGITATVVDARVRLYVVDGTDDAPTVSGAESDWDEASVTWRSQPARTTGAVDNRGAVAAGRWLSYDVTALVEGNGAVTFLLTGGSADAVTFSSRESARNHPQLVVTQGASADRSTADAPVAPTIVAAAALATVTPRPTATRTATPRPTATRTVTPPPTATRTATPRPTATRTATAPPTSAPVATATMPVPATSTSTPIPSATPPPTIAPSMTPTATSTPTRTATSTPTATSAPTQTRTATVTVTATVTATPTRSAGDPLRWGVISNDHTRMTAIREAGIGVKVIRVSWRALVPAAGTISAAFVQRKQAEIDMLRGAGFALVIDIGLQDAPAWVHTTYASSRYVDQRGVAYTGDGNIDAGEANLVFNRQIQAAAGWYIDQVFASFGTDFYGVRLGGGRYGELTYPPHDFAGSRNSYWGFDANALAGNPVPLWRPGAPSPNGEAGRFLNWYLDALVNYQTWQIGAIRRSYPGLLMALYPSWGLRPGQVQAAIAGNLAGGTSAEINGEVQRGFDFARQVAAIVDPKVVLTTTWLDAPEHFGGPGNPTPVAYLAELAAAHPLRLRLYGENTGWGSPAQLSFSAAQAKRYGLIGMVWYREEQLFSAGYASLEDYRRVIVSHQP